MKYSKLLGKTRKRPPKDAVARSHKLLVRAGFIDQLMAGVFTFLPLGWRVHRKIEEIVREEMNNIGGQEFFMPALQKKSQWVETERWDTFEPPLFKFEDRHGRELALGPTHEEIVTDLVRRMVESYRDLPFAVYQMQDKFRNEMRATGGILRTREFIMKDLYSFHKSEKGARSYFEKVKNAYRRIFERCGTPAVVTQALGGSIGGTTTYEFQIPSQSGEDTVYRCRGCGYAFNQETGEKTETCPECGKRLQKINTIEAGHIFNLGIEYSQKMDAFFTNEKGEQKPIYMGCYGIGIGRLMGAVVEVNSDQKGILWPKGVAPYRAHLLFIGSGKRKKADRVYRRLKQEGVETLYDDREKVSAGEKLADADLIGCPVRLIVSEKTGNKVEWSRRRKEKKELLSPEQVVKKLS